MMMAIPPAFAELHMKELQEVVIPKVSTQWIQIAPLMNFDPSEIQNIKEKCGDDPNKCCAELFEIWLQKEPGRQWEDLLPILEKADSMIYDRVTAHLLGYPRRLSSLSTYTDSMLRSKYLGQPTMIGGLPTIASAMSQGLYTGPSLSTKVIGEDRSNKASAMFQSQYTGSSSFTKMMGEELSKKGYDVWIQYVSNKYYPATDPEWKHGKEIDGLLKHFPVIVYSIVPDSKRKTSGEHDIHFSYSDYDIFEVSKCDKNITKLLCIKKKNSTQFEKIFSKVLFSEKFKHLGDLEAYLKEEKSSDFYLLFIRPVESKVKGVSAVLTPPTSEIQKVERACLDIIDKCRKTNTAEIHKSVTNDGKENPVNKIKFRKMYHVSNKPDLPDSNHPDWNEIEVAEARYVQYHGNLLLGLPVAGFTIAPLGKSIYPFQATTGKEYYRVQVPFNPIQYDIFNMNDGTTPADQTHLLCIRKNDDERIYSLLEDKLLPHDEFRSYFSEGYKEDPCNIKNRAAINVYFIENIPIKCEKWDKVEKEHYDFGLIQATDPQSTNQQLLDAWIRRQSNRVAQEFIEFIGIDALVLVLQELGLM